MASNGVACEIAADPENPKDLSLGPVSAGSPGRPEESNDDQRGLRKRTPCVPFADGLRVGPVVEVSPSETRQ